MSKSKSFPCRRLLNLPPSAKRQKSGKIQRDASICGYCAHLILGKKNPAPIRAGTFGGGEWIRTTEVVDNRFTVCPLWPLGNSPMSIWSWWTDLNPRPADYKSAALPTELHQHLTVADRDYTIIALPCQAPKLNNSYQPPTRLPCRNGAQKSAFSAYNIGSKTKSQELPTFSKKLPQNKSQAQPKRQSSPL